jgi:serine protease Do
MIKHHPAKLVANDKLTDLALLEMEKTEGQRILKTTPALPWGDSSELRSGDSVYAIGHPLGMEWSVSRGIVSNPSRRLQNTWQPVIQTDVAINVGNSGGPLFNLQGEVVGVNTFIFTPGQGGSVGVNFSVDGNQAQYIIDSLLKYGKVKRSRMGLAYIVDKDKGVLRVEMVMTDSPAERAGIEKGDVLLGINKRLIKSSRDIGNVLDKVEAGTAIDIIVERNGMVMLKELITGEMID